MKIGEIFEKAKKEFILYYKTCPLCKWPTNSCRFNEGYRECIGCKSPKWEWYSYKPMPSTNYNIRRSFFYINLLEEEIINKQK